MGLGSWYGEMLDFHWVRNENEIMTDSQSRDQFDIDICCPRCGQRGKVRWEENGMGEAGPVRTLVKVSSGFEQRSGSSQSGDPTIRCERCGAIQKD